MGYLASSLADVKAQMTFAPKEPRDFHRFLDKFRILDEIKWNERLVAESIHSVCDGLRREGVDYALLDFSINKYMEIGWTHKEAIWYIHEVFRQARPGGVGLVLSLKYESSRPIQRQYAKLIEDPDVASRLVGIDLVGDEAYFDAPFYKALFKDWIAAKKMVRAHVGESQVAENVRKAIEVLGVTNIAHGFMIYSHPDIIKVARDHDITFDMAITSNYITGVWEGAAFHPFLSLLNEGLRVTLGSDDPVQCGTTLQQEYEKASELGATKAQIKAMKLAAAERVTVYDKLHNGVGKPHSA